MTRAAIEQGLGSPSYRDNALWLQASMLRAGGVTKAADVVEQAIATGQPVLADATTSLAAVLEPAQ